MTRSVTIVNTSNWKHEDVFVGERYDSKGMSMPGNAIRLAPGDKMTVGPYEVDKEVVITIKAVEDKKPEPFMVQVCPDVKVEMV